MCRWHFPKQWPTHGDGAKTSHQERLHPAPEPNDPQTANRTTNDEVLRRRQADTGDVIVRKEWPGGASSTQLGRKTSEILVGSVLADADRSLCGVGASGFGLCGDRGQLDQVKCVLDTGSAVCVEEI